MSFYNFDEIYCRLYKGDNMGNSQGTVYDANEILIHSFLLDADHSLCSCPLVCTGQTVRVDMMT